MSEIYYPKKALNTETLDKLQKKQKTNDKAH